MPARLNWQQRPATHLQCRPWTVNPPESETQWGLLAVHGIAVLLTTRSVGLSTGAGNGPVMGSMAKPSLSERDLLQRGSQPGGSSCRGLRKVINVMHTVVSPTHPFEAAAVGTGDALSLTGDMCWGVCLRVSTRRWGAQHLPRASSQSRHTQ